MIESSTSMDHSVRHTYRQTIEALQMAINGTRAHLSKFSVSLNSSETPAIPRGVITCSPQFVSGIPARCSASDIIARGHCPRGLYICTKKKNQSGYDYEWIMQRPLSSSSPPRRAAGEEAVQPRAKRPRAAQACDRCRLKKYKCDESYPCSHCKKSQIDCVYQGSYRQREDNRSSSYVSELEKRVEKLSSKLRSIDSAAASVPRLTTSLGNRTAVQPVTTATPCSLSQHGSTPREEAALPGGNRDESADSTEEEISEFNHHTNGIEFHGSTSSAAFIGHLEKAREPKRPEEKSSLRPRDGSSSLISTLHNFSFSPSGATGPVHPEVLHEHNFYFEQAHAFMNGYFENIHFIHPFVDKEDFSARAHDLWFNRNHKQPLSFIALYLSVLSFGALVRVWDEEVLNGLTRFGWSRKLFREAQMYLNYLQFSNDLETVQCLYLMAKVCQNELNPNLAYMYLGIAIRTCLSAGFNREVRNPKDQREAWISKTWWGLFSLEIEMSFSVGRPDTLGMDEYHNRALSERDDSEYAIIPWMVDFAQIIRKVSVQIYHSRLSLQDKLQHALQIESEMDSWVARLPPRIKPDLQGQPAAGGALRDPKWARRQRLVLGIRELFLMMRVGGWQLTGTGYYNLSQTAPELDETISKCLDSAMKTIEVIHDIYRIHTFFRCWWYNTTYIMFATTTLLLPMSKLGMCPQTLPLARSVEMAVEILEAMDESIVARKSVDIISHYLREFRASNNIQPVATDMSTHSDNTDSTFVAEPGPGQPGFDIPEWAYGFGFPDYSFDGIARLFDDLSGLPMLDN